MQGASSPSGPDADQRSELVAAGIGLALEAAAAEATAALTDAGVQSIVVKGPAVIRWLYPDRTDRFSVDVDVLVSPANIAPAANVLARLGYEPFEPRRDDKHAQSWTRTGDGRDIDLHHTLVGVGTSDEEAWRVLWDASEMLEIGGSSLRVLVPHARALHLALHVAQEVPDKRKALRDLARGLELLPLETWREAHGLARALRAEPAFAAGLRLLPEGKSVAATLDLRGEMTAEVALRVGNPPDMSLSLNRFLDLHGRGRMVYAARRAFPSPRVMRARVPLARRGPAGLTAAYVRRAVWLVAHFRPALAAVRAARERTHPRGGRH